MRSPTGRRGGASRVYSLKPVTLPTDHLPMHLHLFLGMRNNHSGGNSRNTQDAFVFVREHFDESGQRHVPTLQYPSGLRTIGEFSMPSDQAMQRLSVFQIGYRFQVYVGPVTGLGGKCADLIQDVSNPARHSGSEVAARLAEHYH